MTPEDLPVPPKGFMTLEEEETLTRLRQERHDAAREERELLLAARTRETTDYRLPKLDDMFESLAKGMSPREREGFGLLYKHEFERWEMIQERGFAAVRAQHELFEAVKRRVRANFERGAAADEPAD
jgi:hypothetical protein